VANKAQLQQKKPGRSIPPVAIVAAVVGVLGVALFFYLERESHKPAPPPPPLTGMAKAYVGHLKLLDVEMNAKESYLKQSVVEITGKIGNEGDRVLQFVEINCVFYDAYGRSPPRARPHRFEEDGQPRAGRNQEFPPGLRQHSGELEPGDALAGDRPYRLLLNAAAR
jgi:hypothetical protein